MKDNVFAAGNFHQFIIQKCGIGLTHIRKPGPEFIQILPPQWIIRKKIDMIIDQHQASFLKTQIHGTCCIGKKKIPDTQKLS